MKKVIQFGLLGVVGSLVGCIAGETILHLGPPPKHERHAPSLVSKPEVPPAIRSSKVTPPPPPEIKRPELAAPPPPQIERSLQPSSTVAPPPPPEIERRVREAGGQTGEVQISLKWDNFNDLDLHCIDPRSERIYYQNKRSSTGGELDVDRNAGGIYTREPVENIRWLTGTAPHGKYQVLVNHYANHGGTDPTFYEVSILSGDDRQEFKGQISYGETNVIHEFYFPPANIYLAAPPRVEVLQGNEMPCMVKVARDGYEGPIEVRSQGLSAGVTIDPITIPPDSEEATITLVADGTAAIQSQTCQLLASGGGAEVQVDLIAVVLPARIYLAAPPRVEVRQGDQMPFTVKVARDGYEGPIDVRSEMVPEGLIVNSSTIPSDSEEATIIVVADKTASTQPHSLQLIASGGAAEMRVNLTAVVLPARIYLAAPPSVEVLQGDKMPFTVKVARDGYEGPIDVRSQGVPTGITVDSITIPPNSEDATLTLVADQTATTQPNSLRLVATGGGAEAEVNLTATVLPATVLRAVWSWRNLFLVALWTALLAICVSIALAGGQNVYLGKAMISLSQLGMLLLGGVTAGAAAGAIGQTLFTLFTFIDVLPQIGFLVGWILLGGLLGAGMSFFIPNLGAHRAGPAGAIGGLIGGAAFILVTLGSGDIFGRVVGSAILGLTIGMILAIVESAFRSAWLDIGRGREKRAISLGLEPITIGSDRRTCTIYASGAAPRAYRFWLSKGKILCHDLSLDQQTQVHPGDSRIVGNLEVKVCGSANVAQQIAVKRPPPPPVRNSSATMSSPPKANTSVTMNAPSLPSTSTAETSPQSSEPVTEAGSRIPRPPPPPPPRFKKQ